MLRFASKAVAAERRSVPVSTQAVVREAVRSSGKPLDGATRELMESRFGHSFADVRVHAHGGADTAASALDARAFTIGRDIAFAHGEYAPQSDAGRRLLAHELSHVVQQRAGLHAGHGSASLSDLGEREADIAAADIMSGRKATVLVSANRSGTAGTMIQRQRKGSVEARTAAHGATKKDLNAQVAAFKARALFLAKPYIELESAYTLVKMSRSPFEPDADHLVHKAIAFLFIKHNPGATIKSMNNVAVAIDTTEIPEWKEKEALEDYSHGTYLATHFPDYKKFFITGPGTLWITRAGVEASPSDYRDFLWRSGGVPESEFDEVMDPMYLQLAHDASAWIKKWDSDTPREAPAVIQFIADLNPLVGIAKLISIIKDDKPLYAMPGTKATKADAVDAVIGFAGGLESIFGEMLQGAVKGAGTIRAVKIARAVANPLGKLSEAATDKVSSMIATAWAKDETLKQIFASMLVEPALDEAVSAGVVEPIVKLTEGEPSDRKPGPTKRK